MAGSLNKVMLIGNLGKDPEIRRTQDGRPIANMSVATSESWKDKATGERKERTEWHRVVVFNEHAREIRRGISPEGNESLRRGAPPNPQVAGQRRQRSLLDGGRRPGVRGHPDIPREGRKRKPRAAGGFPG